MNSKELTPNVEFAAPAGFERDPGEFADGNRGSCESDSGAAKVPGMVVGVGNWPDW